MSTTSPTHAEIEAHVEQDCPLDCAFCTRWSAHIEVYQREQAILLNDVGRAACASCGRRADGPAAFNR